MLKNFGATNFMGFKKIWKKYKKNTVMEELLSVDDLLLAKSFTRADVVEIIEIRVQIVFG